MQEGVQVGWDPVSLNYHLPWGSRLLILYLLAVVTVSAVKSSSILQFLWFSKRNSLRPSSPENEFVQAWESCSNKVQSIKRWTIVSLFWTVFVSAMLLRINFLMVVEQKRFWLGAFYGYTVEILTIFALGILVCAVLYTECAFCEEALLRRRESWRRSRAVPKER
jgi:hypothetical protein